MSVRVVELTVQDLPEVVTFVCDQAGTQRGVCFDPAVALPRYRWLLEENPRRRGDFIGWGLRDATGALAGTNLCLWQHYERAGEIQKALHSGDYYVAGSARGPSSVALLLNMLRHPEADLSICATANVNGAAVWKAIKGIPVEGSGRELLIPVNMTALAAGVLAGKLPPGILRRTAAGLGAWLPRTGPRFSRPADMQIEEVRAGDISRITALPITQLWEPQRDGAWLLWRYTAEHSARSCRLLRISRSGPGGDLFVGIHIGNRGAGGRIRSLTILDVWGAGHIASAQEVIGTLAVHFRSALDVICLRLQAAKLWKDQWPGRSRLRELEAHTHWMISRKQKLNPAEWAFTMADGDGRI